MSEITLSSLPEDYRNVFIDETGNFGFKFDSQGCSSHYIISAIIISNENLDSVSKSVDKIRSEYFGTGEIKYSRLKYKRDERTIEILNKLKDIDFKVICFIVDKQNLAPTLQNKKSFIKFLNNLLFKELKLTFNALSIVADQQGTENFMTEFANYFDKQIDYNLFSDYELNFADSKSCLCVQLADFICGVFSSGFEKNRISEQYKLFKGILEPKILRIDYWPFNYESYSSKIHLINSKHIDDAIAETCMKLCIKFIKENEKNHQEEVIDQILTIKLLMSELYFGNGDKYISSSAIKKHIFSINGRSYDKQNFMGKIIAKLRDKEVIISSSNKGYKVPINEKQLYSYTNHCYSIVEPLMSRLKKCRNRILQSTDKQLDILDNDKYKKMKEYIEN